MSIEPIAFWGLAVVLLASSLAVVLTRNLFHSVLYLALSLTATAGVFLSLDAEFLAAVQLLLYAGGVVTIAVFAIVVTERLVGDRITQTSRQILTGFILSGALLVALLAVFRRSPLTVPAARGDRRSHARDRAEPAHELRAALRAAGRAVPGRAGRRALLREAGRLSMTLQAYLTLAAMLFCIGLFGVITRRNTIGILLGIELMLNAVNINLVAFARFLGDVSGMVFTVFTICITVAEVALGLALVILIFRVRRTAVADHLDLLKG